MVIVNKRKKLRKRKSIVQNDYNSDTESNISDSSSDISKEIKKEEENGIIPQEETISQHEGWADAMKKVLAKTGPTQASSMILAKTKLCTEVNVTSENKLKKKEKQLFKLAWNDMNYVKPNVLDKEYERALQKTATRGVVQLFNAVKKHQNDMNEKLKEAKTEHKKEKLYKNLDKGKFLKMLSGEKEQKIEQMDEAEPKPAWKVLHDDFMLGNDMGDWDKQADDDNDVKKVSKKRKKLTA